MDRLLVGLFFFLQRQITNLSTFSSSAEGCNMNRGIYDKRNNAASMKTKS